MRSRAFHWRLIFVLVASVVASLALVTTGPARPPAAQAATAWPASLNPKQVAGQLLAHPDGMVSVSGCRYRPDPTLDHDLTTFSPDGTSTGVVMSRTDHQIDFCDKWTVSGRGGLTYVVEWWPATNKNYLVAFRNGTQAWSVVLSGGCTSSVSSSKRGMVAGPNGDLYVLLEECNRLSFIGVTAAGWVKFRRDLGDSQDYGNQRAGTLLAYRDGLVVLQNNYHNAYPTMIRYFDFAGQENVSRRFTRVQPANETYGEWGITYGGELYLAINRRDARSEPCAVPWLTNRVLVFKAVATGISRSSYLTESLCLLAGQIIPTGNGNAVVVHDRTSDFDRNHVPPKSSPLYTISNAGVVRQRPLALAPNTSDPDSRVTARVGVNGTTMVHRWVKWQHESRKIAVSEWILLGRDGQELARYSSSSLAPTTTVVGDAFAIPSSDLWTVVNGAVYAVLCDTTLDSMECKPDKAKLYKLPFLEAGFDYLKGRIAGVMDPIVHPIDLVVMGDSYSSGEGVEPFTAATNTADNQCHRSELAYGPLLARDPTAAIRLQGFVACSGATSQHLVETSRFGEPAQIRAVTKNTDVVIMTIGGNDVDFDQFASSCTFGYCEGAPTEAILDKIEVRLGDLLYDRFRALKRRLQEVGSPAKVYVTGYPWIVPPKDKRESSWSCPVILGTNEISAVEADKIIAVTNELNWAIERQAERVGFTYISATDNGSPFRGHELCNSGDDSYFHTARLPREYSYHPNRLGQYAYAVLLVEKGVIQ